MADPTGVVFPEVERAAGGAGGTGTAGAGRSTSALGRAVVAAALGAVDPVGAAAVTRETNWRQGYLGHFRRLVEAGLTSEAAAVDIARAGLTSLHARMRVATPEGEVGLGEAFSSTTASPPLDSLVVQGSGTRREELSLPFRGDRLVGSALLRQLDDWVARGILEPSAADAVRLVVAEPERLTLEGRRVVVLGAGAEMGPLRALLSWGADVVAVDLPRPEIWDRLLPVARASAGRLTIPVARGAADGSVGVDRGGADRAGADLLHSLPLVTDWLEKQEGGSSSATTCMPTAPPTCASPLPWTRSRSSYCGDGRVTSRSPSSPHPPMCSPSRVTRSSTPCGPTTGPGP